VRKKYLGKRKQSWSIDMSDQLQELLKKVYEEGVGKAEAEAGKSMDNAKQEAAKIKETAQKEADQILQKAKKEAEDLKKNTDSDLKLAAQHTINSLKSRITDLILSSVYDSKINSDLEDPQFTKQVILQSLEAWKSHSQDATISLPKAMEDKLEEQFIASMKKVLDNKLKIDFLANLKQGFVLAPQDGSYKISFTDDDFAMLFKSYLRPRTQKLLFEA